MLKEEVTVAETPKDTNARETGISSSLDVDITIAHIDSPLLPYSQFTKGSYDGIWRRFLTDSLGFMFTNSHLNDIREEMTTEFLGGSHHLIADDSYTALLPAEFLECLKDAVIRMSCIQSMLHIMLAESSKGFIEQRIASTLRHSTFHQLTNPITHKATDIVDGVFWHPMRPKGIVRGGRQIAKCIEECPVKVKDICPVFHRFERVIIVRTLLLYLVAASRSSMVRCMRYFQRL